MPRTRRRRIVRRAVMVLAVVVLLVSGYVGSVAGLIFLIGAGWMPESCKPAVYAFNSPARRYLHGDLPGADYLLQFLAWAQETGHEVRDRR